MRLRASIAATLLIAAACTSGCGAKDVVDPESVADAAQATIDAGGSRIAITGSVTVSGKKLTFTGMGVQNAKGSLGEIDTDFTDTASQLPKDLKAEDLQFQEVFAHDILYISSPLLRRKLPSGKRWIKLDAKAIQRGLGTDQLAGGGNPADILSYLRGAGDVTERATEAVRGVECTHYSGTIDLRKLPAKLPPAERARAQQGIERVIKLRGGDSTEDFDVWIDKKNLVRRFSESQAFEIEPGRKFDSDETVEFFDFGTTTVVRVPTSEQVEDVTKESISEILKRTN